MYLGVSPLTQAHPAVDPIGRALKIANVLRAHGTRIAVAEKNIGQPQYRYREKLHVDL